ncbi:hypothetical protein PIB30_033013 [Stylosanthes scabra]|uniref:Uncharacterized protein n=1 Tax=Stylosanthes scabra TaxID=79078 RepID=A0ABU6VFA8_9FABA|nr:hypothetical protein [Stylosanthes scabra]
MFFVLNDIDVIGTRNGRLLVPLLFVGASGHEHAPVPSPSGKQRQQLHSTSLVFRLTRSIYESDTNCLTSPLRILLSQVLDDFETAERGIPFSSSSSRSPSKMGL